MRLLAAGDILRLWAEMETTFFPLALAQRARCAAAIRARPEGEILPLRDAPFVLRAESALVRPSS
jgi:hypothetical protein